MAGLGLAAFTERGKLLAAKLEAVLSDQFEIHKYEKGLSDWTRQQFEAHHEAIIFVGACGIAVRAIAPYLKSKTTDPAVLVIDEAGQFVISLVSGHLGGANELAAFVAEQIHATPVITTATDVNGRFAVDVFAKQNRLSIESMQLAKEISAAILRGQKIGFFCQNGFSGELPPELVEAEEKLNIWISSENPPDDPEKKILHLIPRRYVLGIGCRKEKPYEEIEAEVLRVLESEGIAVREICGMASIDLKKDEKGLLTFSDKYRLPFVTYSAEELMAVEGEFSPSEFVKGTTGVDNVCERSAVRSAGAGCSLIHKKDANNGVTVAIAARNWSVKF